MSTGVIPQVDENAGVRTTALDTTRATEQTGILMAHLLGRLRPRQGPRDDGPKILAWQSMVGYLREATMGSMRIAYDHADLISDGHFVDERPGRTGGAFIEFLRRCHRVRPMPMPTERLDMEYVVSPVDGATALYRGLAGVLSVLAGGRPKSFPQPKAAWYLIIATAPGLVRDCGWQPDLALNRRPDQMGLGPALDRLISDLLRVHVPSADWQSFSTSTLLAFDRTDPVAQACGRHSRLRLTTGSPVANALAVYALNSTFDMFTAVVKGVQAALIAVAARTTGGGFYAYPIVRSDDPRQSEVTPTLYRDDHFVQPEADVFLNATAISHSAVLEGVRFDERAHNVITQTLSLRSLTKSQRRILHVHNLSSERRFYLYDDDGNSTVDLKYPEILTRLQEVAPPANAPGEPPGPDAEAGQPDGAADNAAE